MKYMNMNRFILILSSMLLLFSLTACQGQQQAGDTSPENTPQETPALAVSEVLPPAAFWEKYEQTADAQLIDVRTPEEIAEGKVTGASMIDYRAADFQAQIEKLDKEKAVFLYCRSGGRSGQAAAQMERLGFKHVVDMKGGMIAWTEAGMPVEK